MPPQPEDDTSTLERARERLYRPGAEVETSRAPLSRARRALPHAWKAAASTVRDPRLTRHHVRYASYFLAGAIAFFLIAAGIAAYLLYYGGNAVSVKNIDLQIQGPSSIAGGDTVPLSLAITNRNTVAIDNANLEIDFPEGTRSATNVLAPLTVYSDKLGTIASGQTVTRSIKAVVFGAAGSTVSLPVSLSYGSSGSNATFVKKMSYDLAISSTPLSVSVDTVAETVSDKPFTITVQARNNATVPIDNVVVDGTFPSGYTMTSSSVPASDQSFVLGTLAPGASKTITIAGYLEGQTAENRVFHFTIGTGNAPDSTSVAVSYMTQDATVAIQAPFIATSLTVNGADLSTAALSPASEESINVSYANTLPVSVDNATVAVTLSGSAVDYSSIQTNSGFYRSSDHTVLFSKDTDPSLASLAPGAKGLGTFTFSTLPASQAGSAPSVTFTISISGTRIGQSNVPEQVSASQTKTVKVTTALVLAAKSLHASSPFGATGPVPPTVGSATTYAIDWHITNGSSSVAGATVTATLPSYVDYTSKTSGQGTFSYDSASRVVTWNAGDLSQGAVADGMFQVSITPSSSQQGSAPDLTSAATLSGYDRYAGVNLSATAEAVDTETRQDANYRPGDGTVQ